MKKTILFLSLQLICIFSDAKPLDITDVRKGGFLFGYLSSLSRPQNAGDRVLIVSADVECTLHKAMDEHSDDLYNCLGLIGGITGDLAEEVYNSLPRPSRSESVEDNFKLRRGEVRCVQIDEGGKDLNISCSN